MLHNIMFMCFMQEEILRDFVAAGELLFSPGLFPSELQGRMTQRAHEITERLLEDEVNDLLARCTVQNAYNRIWSVGKPPLPTLPHLCMYHGGSYIRLCLSSFGFAWCAILGAHVVLCCRPQQLDIKAFFVHIPPAHDPSPYTQLCKKILANLE